MDEYHLLWMHVMFSTRGQRPTITPTIASFLEPSICAIARALAMHVMAVGGTADHVHLLLSLPPTLSVDDAVTGIKQASAAWINDCAHAHREFAWQEGYGAFSLSSEDIATTIDYIQTQHEHHLTQTYKEEYVAILDEYGIEYDLEGLWE